MDNVKEATTKYAVDGFKKISNQPKYQNSEQATPSCQVFLSHSGEDKAWVQILASELKNLGLEVFFDEWEISPGDVFVHKLESNVLHSMKGAIVISPSALSKSKWVSIEYATLLNKAAQEGRLLIPIIYKDGGVIPPFLTQNQWIDFRGELGQNYVRKVFELANALRGIRRAPPPRQANPPKISVEDIDESIIEPETLNILREDRIRLSLQHRPQRLPKPVEKAKDHIVFLSHSSVDSKAALNLAQAIEQDPKAKEKNIKVWLSSQQPKGGKPQPEQIEEVIQNDCTAFLVYLGSRGTVNWVNQEITLGMARTEKQPDFPFIPILSKQIKEGTSLPSFVSCHNAIQAPEDDTNQLEQLLQSILDTKSKSSSQLVVRPFVGLQAFKQHNAHLFHGRKLQTEKLLQQLSMSRLVVIVGDSGTGKSSLLNAGLIPSFRGGALSECVAKQETISKEQIWHVVQMRPKNDPFESLSQALIDATQSLGKSIENINTLASWILLQNPTKIADALSYSAPIKAQILLVIDQFEELFTNCSPSIQESFIKTITHLTQEKTLTNHRVVIAVRKDYYNLSCIYPDFYQILENPGTNAKFSLRPMTDEQLSECIEKPLRLTGISDTQDLAAQIIADLGDHPSDLAMIQVSLTECWRQRNNHNKDLLKAYTQVGTVTNALTQFVENIYRSLDTKEQELLEFSFMRLVQLGQTGGTTRRIALQSEFSDETWTLLQKLASDEYGPLVEIHDQTIELSHESIYTHWPRYQLWLQKQATTKRSFDELINIAKSWNQTSKSGEFLLKGGQLEDALQLEKNYHRWLSKDEIALLNTSRRQAKLQKAPHTLLFLVLVSITIACIILYAFARNNVVEAQQSAHLAKEEAKKALQQATFAHWAKAHDALEHSDLGKAALHFLEAAQSAPTSDAQKHSRKAAASILQLQPQLSKVFDINQNLVLSKDKRHIATWNNDSHVIKLLDNTSGEFLSSILQHDSHILGALFSNNGKTVLSWTKDGLIRLWDTTTGKLIGPIFAHTKVSGATFSHDNQNFISWSKQEGTLRLWSITQGKQRTQPHRPFKHDNQIHGAIFSHDNNLILSWGNSGIAKLWNISSVRPRLRTIKLRAPHQILGVNFSDDSKSILLWSKTHATLRRTKTGRPISQPIRHQTSTNIHTIDVVSFSQDAKTIVTKGSDHTIRFWNSRNARLKTTPLKHKESIISAFLSPTEKLLISWSQDYTVCVWNTTSGQLMTTFKHKNEILGATLSENEKTILSWSKDKSVNLWDNETGHQLASLKHSDEVLGATFLDSSSILTWTHNTARLWKLKSTKIMPKIPPLKHKDFVMGALFANHSKTIFSWSEDGTAKIWDTKTGKAKNEQHKPESFILKSAVSQDEAKIISLSEDGCLKTWNTTSGEVTKRYLEINGRLLGGLFSKDKRTLLTWSDNGTARLWSTITAKPLTPPLKHDEIVSGAIFSHKEHLILSWTDNGTIKLWDAQTGQSQTKHPLVHNEVIGIQFSHNDQSFVSWSHNGTILLWSVDTKKPTTKPIKHLNSVGGVKFALDDQSILSWSYKDGSIGLWRTHTGLPALDQPIHHTSVLGASFSPDQKNILSWSSNGTAKLWYTQNGLLKAPILQHKNAVLGAIFSPDGETILSWSEDFSIYLWNAQTGGLQAPPMLHDNVVLGAMFSSDGQSILSWSGDNTVKLWSYDDYPIEYLKTKLNVITGTSLTSSGQEHMLSKNQWHTMQKKLHELTSRLKINQ